jgi:predicted NBD/HSP70 family sugar kinase
MNAARGTLADLNLLRIRRAIWLRPGISRAELARELGLDKSTVTKLVACLLRDGVAADMEKRASGPRGGRKPISLKVRPSYGCVLGIEMQTDCYRADVIDLGGEVLQRFEESLSPSPLPVVESFLAICATMKSRTRGLELPLLGIGVGMPGIIDPRSGVITCSLPLQILEPYRFFQELAATAPRGGSRRPPMDGAHVMIDNDARCGCWSVLSHHRAESPANFLFLFGEFRSVSRSDRRRKDLAVGFGIVLDHRVHYGDEGASGEFISAFREADQDNQFSVTDEEAQSIDADPRIRRRVLGELARNASLISNVINVNTVYLGGSLTAYGEELAALLKEESRRHATSSRGGNLTVELAPHGDHVVAYGAAGMVLERFFSVPEIPRNPTRVPPIS